MSTSEHDIDDTHPMELLLPWYVAGTLSHSEAAEVKAWLENNPEAEAHLERVREENLLAIEAAERIPMPRAAAVNDLMAQLGVDGRPRQQMGFADRFWAMLSPRWALAGAAALALAVAIQAVTIGTLVTTAPQSTFQTASGPSETITGPSALVAFQPEQTMAAITAYLAQNQLTIIEGPKPGGIYRIGGQNKDALQSLENNQELVSFFALTGE